MATTFRALRLITFFAAVMLLLPGTAAAQVTSNAAEQVAVPDGFRIMRLRTVDSAGKPVAQTRIHVSIWPDGAHQTLKRDYKTDARGAVDVLVPEPPRLFRIWTQKPGYVPLFAQWWPKEQPDGELIPDEFTLTLPKGTRIGGVVKNDAGQPIEGVAVEVMLANDIDERRERPVPSIWLAEKPGPGNNPCITNAEGRWSLDNVPAGDDTKVSLKLTHPDYVSDENWGTLQTAQSITMKSLREESATVVMKGGIMITGTVVDPRGNPVHNAEVLWGKYPYMSGRDQMVRTDDQGQYRLGPLNAGQEKLTVVAEGWMPEQRAVEIARDMSPVDFQLRAGKPLRVRFVDQIGNPLAHVGVTLEDWRGGETLSNAVDETRIPRRAGANGVFEWTWAPDDALKFRCSKDGFASLEFSVIADGTEHLQTMLPILQMTGTVRDAATGAPIDDFTIVPVIYFRPNFVYVNRRNAVRGSEGNFEIQFDRTDIDHGVQIEKEGYRAQLAGPWKIGVDNILLDVDLEPAPPVSGRVVDGEGRPVRGARVYLGTHTQHLDIPDHQSRGGSFTDVLMRETDGDGRFSFVAQYEPYVITAIHDAGYARILRQPEEQPGELELQRWASVEGRLLQAGEPVVGARVTLTPLRPRFFPLPRIAERFWRETDSEGRFVFERVPPGACQLMAQLSVWDDYPITSSQAVPLELKPGERRREELGGEGARIAGRVVLADDGDREIDWNYALNYLLRKAPGVEPQREVAAKGFDWRRGWSDAWTSTEEGQAYLETLHHYFVKLNRDGTFLVSGVPAGEYELALKIYEPPREGCLVSPIGTKVLPFEVTASDVEAGSLNLGDVHIDVALGPQPGQPVPDVEFESADGAAQTVSGQRGRYVLLSFWATWCGSCVQQLPALKQLHEARDSDRFAVVSLNLDADKDVARRFVAEQKLDWAHAYLGDWTQSDVPTKYGISSVPVYFLIGPDGKLIGRSYDIAEAAKGIDQELAPPK